MFLLSEESAGAGPELNLFGRHRALSIRDASPGSAASGRCPAGQRIIGIVSHDINSIISRANTAESRDITARRSGIGY